MVLTRSGLSTDSINKLVADSNSSDPIDHLYVISIMTELYHNQHTVNTLYTKFTNMSKKDKHLFLDNLKLQYSWLKNIKTMCR